MLSRTFLYVVSDIFTPGWQKKVRQITFEFVEAMKERKNENDIMDGETPDTLPVSYDIYW